MIYFEGLTRNRPAPEPPAEIKLFATYEARKWRVEVELPNGDEVVAEARTLGMALGKATLRIEDAAR